MKISQTVFEYLSGHEIMTGGLTYRRTDKVITIGSPPTSSGGALMRFFSINVDTISNSKQWSTYQNRKSNSYITETPSPKYLYTQIKRPTTPLWSGRVVSVACKI